MSKGNLAKIIKNTKQTLGKRSPEILTGIGIAGMVTTTVLAVRATPKALQLIEEKKNEEQVDKLKAVEVVKTAWKPYIPAALTGAASITCLICATSVSAKRMTVLATAYQLSETARKEFREKTVEMIGEKKEQSIRDKIAKDHIEKNPVGKSEVIVTNNGKTLCYDPISGRYFYSTIDTVKRAELKIKEDILKSFSGYAALNDFYDEIGLPHIDPIGDDLGWNIENNIELHFSSQLNENGEPSIVLDFAVAPKYGYYKFS